MKTKLYAVSIVYTKMVKGDPVHVHKLVAGRATSEQEALDCALKKFRKGGLKLDPSDIMALVLPISESLLTE